MFKKYKEYIKESNGSKYEVYLNFKKSEIEIHVDSDVINSPKQFEFEPYDDGIEADFDDLYNLVFPNRGKGLVTVKLIDYKGEYLSDYDTEDYVYSKKDLQNLIDDCASEFDSEVDF